MDAFSSMGSSMQRMDMKTLFKLSDVSPLVQKHLAKTYSTLTGMVLAAAAGAYTHMLFHLGGTLSTLGTFAVLMYLGYNRTMATQQRLHLALLFGFLKGLSIGGLVEMVAFIDPAIIVTAFMGTVAIFGCFSLAAMFSKRRSYLYLGGILGSALTVAFWLSIANIFFRSVAIMNLQLYGGLFMFVGFVVFDTQLIIEKASLGDLDYPMHAITLFIDFVAIFVRLLIILAKNNKPKEERKNNSRRR